MISVEYILASKLKLVQKNPRLIRDEKFKRLCESIQRDKKYFEQRPCLVNKTKEGLFIYAGAQRFRAAKELGWKEIPCMVEQNIAQEVIDRRMIQDNMHEGEWDFDILANEWDEELLAEFDIGIPEEAKILEPEFVEKNPLSVFKLYVESKNAIAFKNDIESLIAGKYPTSFLQKAD